MHNPHFRLRSAFSPVKYYPIVYKVRVHTMGNA